MQSKAIKILVKNQKGGVGKSLIAFWLAAGIVQQKNAKVLLLTSDSQDNIPIFANKAKEAKELTAGLEAWLEYGKGGVIELRKDLFYIPLKTVSISNRNSLNFKNFIDVMSEKMDYIIIDASPVLELDDLFVEVADNVVIPTFLDAVTTQGIYNLIEKIGLRKIKAVIPNRANKTKLQKIYYEKLQATLKNTEIVLTCPIYQASAISKLIDEGKTVWECKQKSLDPIRAEFQKVIEVI